MKQSIEKYFIAFGHLSLPKIGTIKLEKKDAFLENEIWVAPQESIVFEQFSESPSKHFYSYLAESLAISTDEAILKFDQYINEHIVNDHFDLGSLGRFNMIDHNINFESTYNSKLYVDSINIDTVINQGEHNNQIHTPDHWYVWAIAIALTAVVAILIKYYY